MDTPVEGSINDNRQQCANKATVDPGPHVCVWRHRTRCELRQLLRRKRLSASVKADGCRYGNLSNETHTRHQFRC